MMIRSFVRQAAVLLAGSALALVVGSAQAAAPMVLPVQILDPSNVCATWTAGGTVLAPTLTCVAANGQPPSSSGAPSCTLYANGFNPLTLNAAGTASLAAQCQNVDGTTQYAWTATTTVPNLVSSTQGVTGQSQPNLNIGATTTFTVTPTTGNLTGSAASVTVNITGTSSLPPPSSGGVNLPASCPGFDKVITRAFEWTTPGNFLIDTSGSGSMGTNGALVVTFMTPPTQQQDANLNIGVSEYPGTTKQSGRTVNVSTAPCDFNITTMGKQTGASSTTLRVTLGPSTYGYPMLQPNTRYYVNVSNYYRGANACTYNGNTQACDVRLEIGKPNF